MNTLLKIAATMVVIPFVAVLAIGSIISRSPNSKRVERPRRRYDTNPAHNVWTCHECRLVAKMRADARRKQL